MLLSSVSLGFVLTCLPLLAAGGGEMLTPSASEGAIAGIDPRLLSAYRASDGWCDGLRWELLAGIGWVESRHGTADGAAIDESNGMVSPPILGPPLDGNHGQALTAGRWAGRWGISGPWQQALGPMQFLPGTFDGWAVDGDADGTTHPHDIDDAVPTAANYLCGGRGGEVTDERAALRRYNDDAKYVDDVLAYADSLTRGALLVGGSWLCPVAGATSFTDTWLAPRSGGRRHHGVDMFAAAGTPVVAPVPGVVEHFNGGLGGLSFRLWGDDGNYYFGTHLSAFGAARERIAVGTIVGYVGSTGNAAGTGAHLHFEIHPGRRRGGSAGPTNPTPTVSTHCESRRLGLSVSTGD